MPEVLIEKRGAVALLTLNRPEVMNAYNVALHTALHDAIDEADKDPSVRAIVVTGAANEDMILDGVNRDYGGVLNLRIFESDTPVIGAVNGHAIGIGCTMLLPMDIRVASNKAKFAMPFSRRGIVFDGAASWFLPRIVGASQAQKWIVTGETFLADEAFRTGLVHELHDTEDVLPRAMAIAEDIATNCAPVSMALNKQLLRASLLGDLGYGGGPMGAHMEESVHLTERFQSADCMEGVKSFFEKRAPKFAANEE